MTDDGNALILVYDGDCLFCRHTALAIRLKQAIKQFELIDGRSQHPLATCLKASHLDLNQGIVIIYHGVCYADQDAVEMLATLTTPVNLFNKSVARIFKHRRLSKILYTSLKQLRKAVLWVRGIDPIEHHSAQYFDEAITQAIDQKLPPALFKRYHIDTHSPHGILLDGTLTIKLSRLFKCLSWMINAVGFTISKEANDIPTKVAINSDPPYRMITMKRMLDYQDTKQAFSTQLLHLKNQYFVETFSRFLGWKYTYHLEHNTLNMHHDAMCLRLGKSFIPIPGLGLLMGKLSAQETAIDQNTFTMKVTITHLFEYQLMSYHGVFKVNNTT